VVDLEPAHARFGIAQRAAVVAGPADDDLAEAPAETVGQHAVEERGPRPQVLVHPAVARRLPVGDVAAQRVVGVRVAVAGRGPGELKPVGGDAASGL
jgi:hypothetical protein